MLRGAIDRLSIYLPIALMGLLALGSYWLVRNSPTAAAPEVVAPLRHDPDYYMRDFALRTFDANGRLQREVFGVEGRHYPDTDTLEIDKPRIRAIADTGAITVATAERGLSNGDGSEVQLIGNAIVTREPMTGKSGQAIPRMQFRGEFLHAYTTTERVRSDRPVVMTRGTDTFTGDAMDYDNADQVMQLRGRVHTTLQPRQNAPAR
ncbi:LPS export ABC transporter periplasmic protein LptC [Xylophilus sp. GOD-11R]|uniref:LPS export ABC transporter periplasmic protein LptC n=1 Tax=Xylophilus sp. GOD-11R TaxID=3089814 RepID=UPI00298C3468|nr:LPS export ABC transporter periplasmic protein LptC [Xylophilus sp. GOD-11R]WPB59545.1 LPS export ABC transporter periplasmic protein LptC [Xylophilus sp. GOD-11R]